MAAINAYRMDGLGNDFIIIDRRENSIEIKKNKIIELGNRANIGFDQIIFIEKQKEDSFPITIYNSDGGEVSACGNGARCVAYLLSENLNTKEIRIKTNNRLLNAKIVGDFQVELEMGKPLFGSEEIPLSKKIDPRNVVLDINNQKFSANLAWEDIYCDDLMLRTLFFWSRYALRFLPLQELREPDFVLPVNVPDSKRLHSVLN